MDTKNAPDQTAATTPAEESKPATDAPTGQNPNLTMDVVAAPASSEDTETAENSEDKVAESGKDAKKPAVKKDEKPKTPGDNGVGAAITVAVIAVLVLSALAVFAYMNGTN